ncbi:biopolymer transporter ExbD [Danxiaibacter flavus]|uniref:Biopolymer transporter ExbD n=1 Tax=Danxiaibacter flavus TaxID=3049108 RepID=A0ABV3ZNM7_9BACT|nr:biopolymer transporter ExbD [Chitinophagaceae bacterium DXS]
MAEIQPNNGQKKKGTKGKKLSTRVDLTPMVDLGFLLITFFIFTTTLSSQTAMKLVIPDDRGIVDRTPVPEGKTLNLLLSAKDRIYYYEGENVSQMQDADYSRDGLRQIILAKKKTVAAHYGNDAETIVLIKPTDEASYKNIIDALDEMKINDVKKFVLMDATDNERAVVSKKQTL